MNRSGDNDFEHLTVKLFLPSGEMAITNCYSPPNTKLELHKVKLEESRHLIMGDFNSHSPSWGYATTDQKGEDIEDWMAESRLILINQPDDKPTCYSRVWKTMSTPDLAMATDDIHRHTTRIINSQLGGSDHLPTTLHISEKRGTGFVNMVPSWNYKKANWSLFKEHMDHLCSSITNSQHMNHNVSTMNEAIIQAAKKSIPRGKRRDYKPYWSETIRKLHDDLDNARNIMEQNPTQENIQKHNTIKNTFNEQKKIEIQRSWFEKTSNLNMERDTSKLWKLTKALNEETKDTYCKTVLKDNGKYHTGKMAANILADFYKEEGTITLSRARAKEVHAEIKDKLKNQNPDSSMTTPFTMMELDSAIKKLKNKKAPGKDSITNEMIKNLGPTARSRLLLIFNQSWSSGKIPDNWREAIIIPIRKKEKEKTSKSSYRPISLLSCVGKVMERMVNTRLMKYLEQNQLIDNSQSAFRKNHSTEDHLVYLAQEVENAFQERKKVLSVFVDLAKAFDKIWREGLLLKLLNNKIEGRMYKWIRDLLQYRTARVKLDGMLSHRVTLQQGVPQGGVISPTLFNIFINDITKNLAKHISRALHADDLAIWSAAEHLSTAQSRMQAALNVISKWTSDWGVQINLSKTVVTCFSLSNVQESIKLKIHETELAFEENPTYLGIKLDRRLSWKPHLTAIEQKAVKKLSIMKKLAGTKWGANSRILKNVYTGTVRPVLEYGMSAWATASKTNTERLSKVQNAGLRIITGAIKTTPIQEMENFANIRPLHDRRDEKVLVYREKLQRMTNHPMHAKLNNPTKSRLKRTSFCHISKNLHNQHKDLLPNKHTEMEMLVDFEEPTYHHENVSITMEIPGVTKKYHQTPAQLKALALEMMDYRYNSSEWTQAYTDGSADGAVKNGGGGIFIRYNNGRTLKKAFPTGKLSSNFRAESMALLQALKIFTSNKQPPSKIVFFTDCRSLLESLLNARNEHLIHDIKMELRDLQEKSTIALQWLPSHCGIFGNEKADSLSREGGKMEQISHQIPYREAKTIIHNKYVSQWREKMDGDSRVDPVHQLQRYQQTIIFRLRTGHCRLLSHLYRLRISHTNECPCGTGLQTPGHILQDCPTYSILRHDTWPEVSETRQKLWGSRPDLERTASFVVATGLKI
jgi:ribonuclease HI